MIECYDPDAAPEEAQFSGLARSYVRESDLLGWSGPGEQGLQHAFDQRDCAGLIKKPRVLARLKDLPTKCWTEARNESRGCQWYTKARFGPVTLEVMLDSGAGLNTIPEDTLVDIINANEQAGIKMSDERHPVVELQSWSEPEYCKGVAGGVSVPLIGGVILCLTFVDRNDGRTQTVRAKFKILASGKTDWVPIILGGSAIDHVKEASAYSRRETVSIWQGTT